VLQVTQWAIDRHCSAPQIEKEAVRFALTSRTRSAGLDMAPLMGSSASPILASRALTRGSYEHTT
jgi:hypothetical protein